MQEALTIVGTAVGCVSLIVSLIIAAIQTRRLAKVNQIRVRSLRGSLLKARLSVVETDRLLRKSAEYGIRHNAAIEKISRIHSNSCALVTDLLQELSLAEPSFDQAGLEFYVSTKLITSKWFWNRAAVFVDDRNRNRLSIPPNLPDDTPDDMSDASESLVQQIKHRESP